MTNDPRCANLYPSPMQGNMRDRNGLLCRHLKKKANKPTLDTSCGPLRCLAGPVKHKPYSRKQRPWAQWGVGWLVHLLYQTNFTKCKLIDLQVVINMQSIPSDKRYQNTTYLKEKSQLLLATTNNPTLLASQLNKMVDDNFK